MTDADVYKGGTLAARLIRRNDGVEFRYTEVYLNRGGPPVASTLPLTAEPRLTPAGAVPPFFAGLLPEGRRLTNLQRSLKASADDELSLLLAIGGDTVGDVQVVPTGSVPDEGRAAVTVAKDFSETLFSDLLSDAGIVDPAGLAGVQEKVSARVLSLPVRRGGMRYILKLSPPEFPHVVENEKAFIDLAQSARLRPVAASVYRDADDRPGLLVERFDRVGTRDNPRRLAVEDACQLLDRWPADKYNVTMEEVALAVIGRTTAPPFAARDVFRHVLFAWLTGNGDLHAKNLSVLEREDGERVVAPAYDLPSTMLYDDLTFALEIQGRTDGLSRRVLLRFANDIGLGQSLAEKEIDRMLDSTAGVHGILERLPFESRRITETQKRLAYRRKLLVPAG
ncbi:type II toxin-antitoxin system HipA family toxin [Pseudolysinimonas sp.]|jgi:serine/threonine-protein kinase HipA|uniref:type II toxin-antitoxin system HipA family toxin n=1 Tax=Pseudolysinimonas sp. TaxID=2680009 RepID=UPI003783BEE8